MPDFRVADTAPEHPKLRTAGLAAFGLWAAAGAYSMRELTDGWVPEYWVQTWPNGKRAATALVTVGLWAKDARHGMPGYQFHDWMEYQRSAEQINKERAEGRERAQRSRERHAERSPVRSGERFGNGTDLLASNHRSYSPVTPESLPANGASHERPAPSTPAETSERSPERSANVRVESHDSRALTRALSGGLVSGGGGGGARGDAQTPPRPRCSKHSQLPADADIPPCRACQQQRLDAERSAADNVLGELAARTARRAAIDACPECDDNGMREHGAAVTRCTHPTRLEVVS